MIDYGKRYAGCTLETFDASDNPAALVAVQDLVARRISGVLLSGTVGRARHISASGLVGRMKNSDATTSRSS